MTEDRRNQPGSYVFGAVVGLLVAWLSYQWISDPGKTAERDREVEAVNAARAILAGKLDESVLEFVDPVEPDRKVGKTYVFPSAEGSEVSGYYRRNEEDDWHAYLVRLDMANVAVLVRVQDAGAGLAQRAASDPVLELVP